MWYIAIIITSLLGQSLDVFDWPRYEFKTLALCQVTLDKAATSQTMARLGAEFAATTGEANFTRGYCYENNTPRQSRQPSEGKMTPRNPTEAAIVSRLERHYNRLLFDCYLSGQVSEDRWQKHLTDDPGLREYVRSRVPCVSLPEAEAGSARARALALFLERHPNPDSYQHVAEIAFIAGWNARKQLDFEIALGVKR